MRRRARRGMTLLMAIAYVAIISIAVYGLLSAAAGRHGRTQLNRDRAQALQCAQAGLLWARREVAAGRAFTTSTLDFSPIGRVRIEASAEAASIHLRVTGEALRDGDVQATRTLTVREVLP